MDISMPEVNDKNQTALVYYQPINKLVTLPSGKQIFFKVDRNVSLSWVEQSDVEAVLGILGGCCGHSVNRVFRYASDSDVRLWSHTADR
jgi:hypothetical protein